MECRHNLISYGIVNLQPTEESIVKYQEIERFEIDPMPQYQEIERYQP